MVEEGVGYIEEREVNENIEYADGVRERIRKKRLIEIKDDDGFVERVWAMVVRKLPERMILGNSFLNNGVIINYRTKELLLKKDEDQKKVCRVMKDEPMREKEVIERMEKDYKCLLGIKGNEKWYKMVLGWIIKFENAKDENGWMWANVEPYKPEMRDEMK